MPINFDQLTLYTDVLELPPETLLPDVYGQLPGDRDQRALVFLVAKLDTGRYIVARWLEIEEIARRVGASFLRDVRLMDLPGYTPPPNYTDNPQPGPLPFSEYSFAALIARLEPAEALDAQATATAEAREVRNAHRGKRVVVLEQGRVKGLLYTEVRSGEFGNDPFVRRAAVLSASDEAAPPPQVTPVVAAIRSADAAGDEAEAPGPRGVNCWFENYPKDAPLELERVYELNFNIAGRRSDSLIWMGGDDAPPEQQLEAAIQRVTAKQEFFRLLVALESDDFEIYGNAEQELVVGKVGRSLNRVVFALEPKKEGASALNVMLYTDGRLFLRTTLNFTVVKAGAAPQSSAKSSVQVTSTAGIGMNGAMARLDWRAHEEAVPKWPNVDLVILKKESGYQFLIQGAGFTRAFIRVTDDQLQEYVNSTRTKLRDQVVHRLANNEYVYQVENTTIPANVHGEVLKLLAEEGAYLFNELFYTAGDQAAQQMGDVLRNRSKRQQLSIAIVADSQFVFPWAMLYDGDDTDNPDVESFWGFRHIIQYVPEFTQTTEVNFNPEIQVSDKLDVGFIYNTHLDEQLTQNGYPPPVQPQIDFLDKLDSIKLAKYTSVNDLYNLLKKADSPHQFLYIYAHAESSQAGENVEGSRVIFGDGQATVRDMKSKARTNLPRLEQAPLVFLNACESAELSPKVYTGIVPYLITRGARGVLGTEVETPALFASEFARQFIQRFAAGNMPIGKLLLDMRREYVLQKRNVMGLAYALYSDGDILVKRATA